MSDYQILCGADRRVNSSGNVQFTEGGATKELGDKVCKALKDGWVLFGPPFCNPNGRLYQAMFKE